MRSIVYFPYRFTSAVLICGSVVCCNSARAQEIPHCDSIRNPTVGTVCYSTTNVSFRLKERDACEELHIPVERVAPNAYFTGSSSLEGSGHNVTGPNVSMVSGSGNISYQQLISEKISQLNETKNKLEANVVGCAGPACGEIRNQLDSINRTINEFENSKRLSVTLGKNEKALISVRGCVSCTARLPLGGSCIAYSQGSSWQGRVRFNHRYTSMSESSVQGQTSLLIQKANGLLGSQETTNPPISPANGIRREVWVSNTCAIPMNFALGVLEPEGNFANWRSYGVWALPARHSQPLGNTRGGIVTTTQQLLYIWAQSFFADGTSFGWAGPTVFNVNNQPFNMVAWNATPDNSGRYIIQLSCPPPHS